MAEYQPDVVVADQYALVGALAAHKYGVRWATLCHRALDLTPPMEYPGLQDWVRSKLAEAWAAACLPPDDDLDLRFSPYLVIATTVRALTGTAAAAGTLRAGRGRARLAAHRPQLPLGLVGPGSAACACHRRHLGRAPGARVTWRG